MEMIKIKDKLKLHSYIGDLSQVCGFKQYRFEGGPADGTRAIDVWTGSGLTFTVLIDSGLDIANCNYKGLPISHFSKNGIVHPSLHETEGYGFLRSFNCGLVTTCGMTQQGAACEDEGEKLALHGRYTHTPATLIHAKGEWEGDDYVISIKATVRESNFFAENLLLTREIRTSIYGKEIEIIDVVENQGFDETPFMLLYHCNFGWPVVSENSVFTIDKCDVYPRDEVAKPGFENRMNFEAPIKSYQEQVFIHENFENKESFSIAKISNPSISENFGAYIKFLPSQMPYMTQWKQVGMKDYVCGLEPGTNPPLGRKTEREMGRLKYIQPFEIKKFNLIVGVED